MARIHSHISKFGVAMRINEFKITMAISKRKHKKGEKQETPKTYNIKMPVYTTSMMEQSNGLFDRVTCPKMITFLKDRLSKFTFPISIDNRNKTKKSVMKNIIAIDLSTGTVPSLLLQINAFNTNLYDGYFEGSEKINFSRDNKLLQRHF